MCAAEQAGLLFCRRRKLWPWIIKEHMFYASANDNTHPQPYTSPRLFLAFGLTTIRRAGTDPDVDLNLKWSVDAREVPGPEMHLTSPFVNGERSGFFGKKSFAMGKMRDAPSVIGPPKASPHSRVYQLIPKAALAAIIDEAHRLGLPVTVHLRTVTCREAVELGIDNLEHAFVRALD
jgi:hypothetical protein